MKIKLKDGQEFDLNWDTFHNSLAGRVIISCVVMTLLPPIGVILGVYYAILSMYEAATGKR